MSDDQMAGIRPDALSPAQIEAKAEVVGEAKADMGTRQAFVLACLAGLFIGMGGMFSLVKVRDDVRRGDFADPGWYRHPPGTVAREFTGTADELGEPPRARPPDTPEPAVRARRPAAGHHHGTH